MSFIYLRYLNSRRDGMGYGESWQTPLAEKRVVKSVNCKKKRKKAKKVKKNVDKVVLEMYIVTRRWETGEILRPNGNAPEGVVIRYNRTVR